MHGFSAVTVESLSVEAGIAKTSIYHRWPNNWRRRPISELTLKRLSKLRWRTQGNAEIVYAADEQFL